jgi:hypothetical protein
MYRRRAGGKLTMSERKQKPVSHECWAILSRNNNLVSSSIRVSKRFCIQDYVRLAGNEGHSWRELYGWGWRCIPVTISFTPPARKRAPRPRRSAAIRALSPTPNQEKPE